MTTPVVLVLSWGRAELTARFLDSIGHTECIWLRNETDRDGEAMDVVERSRRRPQLRVIHSETNLGFAGGVNRLVDEALSRGHGHFLICNNDVVFGNYTARRIYADRSPAFAVVGCMTDNGGPQVYQRALQRDAILTRRPRETWWEYDGRLARGLPRTLHELGRHGVSFSCVLISAEHWDVVGPMDAGLGLAYGEDNDWCHRARLAGLKVGYTPNVMIHHDHGASTTAAEEAELRRHGVAALKAKWGGLV